ncbi:MAG TPA: hypothetical protein VF950_04920 [Planctomycetota bacterium]
MKPVRLVRCPFCESRFNVSGVSPGTLLRCGYCTAVLTVPTSDAATRRSFYQIFRRPSRAALLTAAGIVASLALLAAGGAWLLRTSPNTEAAPPEIVVTPPTARPAPYSPPGYIDEEWTRMEQSVLVEFGTGIILYRARPYLVVLEPSNRYVESEVIEEYGRRLGSLRSTFAAEFGDPLRLPPVEGVLPVVILNSRQSFDRYCEGKDQKRMPSAVKGFYDSQRRRVVVYHDFNVSPEVLFHEGAHQLVHYYTRRETNDRPVPSTYWFAEGVGTYFEGFRRRDDGQWVFDTTAASGRLATLKQTLNQRGMKDFIPLSVLMGMSVEQFWDWYEKSQGVEPEEATRRAQLYYAESWALVRFLRHKGPVLRELFEEFFRAELAGRAGRDLVERFLRDRLGQELPDLDREFVDYILEMR